MSSECNEFVSEEKILILMPTELLSFDQELQLEIIQGFARCMKELFKEEIMKDLWLDLEESGKCVYEKIPQKLLENSLPENELVELIRTQLKKMRKKYRVKQVIMCLCGIQPSKLAPFQNELMKMSEIWLKDKLKRIRDKLKFDPELEETLFVHYKFSSFQELICHLSDRSHVIKIKDTIIVN